MYEVYLITNCINGKKYVGRTKRGYQFRFKEHIIQAKDSLDVTSALYNAIRKYGSENFKIELIESNISECDIDDKEIYYIDYYNTFYTSGVGYNMTKGGGGVKGYTHTQATKCKISNSLMGHVFPQSRNEKVRQSMIGREYKQEWKDNLSQARKGRFKGK